MEDVCDVVLRILTDASFNADRDSEVTKLHVHVLREEKIPALHIVVDDAVFMQALDGRAELLDHLHQDFSFQCPDIGF